MLNQELENALNKQLNNELWSSYLYLSMSYDMNNIGFAGAAKWFMLQSQEETLHAQKLANHILSLHGRVRLSPIAEVRQDWGSIKAAIEDTLLHEKQITAHIHKLYETAKELKQYPTVVMLEWYITEQVQEEQTPRDLLESINMIGDNAAAMYMLDQQLGQRALDTTTAATV